MAWQCSTASPAQTFCLALFSAHVAFCPLIYLQRASKWALKDGRISGPEFCTLPLAKGYVLPSRPLFEKEVGWWWLRWWWGSELLCKAIILFTSRCMYKEWQGENGNVREMSNACGPCPVYFTGWNVHSGEEGTDQGDGGGARSHLLMTLNKTGCGATRNQSDGM